MLWHVVLWNKSNQIIPPAYNWPESLQIFMEQHLKHNIMSLYTQFALQQICTPPLYHRGVKHQQYWCTLRPHLKTNCEKITPDTKPLNVKVQTTSLNPQAGHITDGKLIILECMWVLLIVLHGHWLEVNITLWSMQTQMNNEQQSRCNVVAISVWWWYVDISY